MPTEQNKISSSKDLLIYIKIVDKGGFIYARKCIKKTNRANTKDHIR